MTTWFNRCNKHDFGTLVTKTSRTINPGRQDNFLRWESGRRQVRIAKFIDAPCLKQHFVPEMPSNVLTHVRLFDYLALMHEDSLNSQNNMERSESLSQR